MVSDSTSAPDEVSCSGRHAAQMLRPIALASGNDSAGLKERRRGRSHRACAHSKVRGHIVLRTGQSTSRHMVQWQESGVNCWHRGQLKRFAGIRQRKYGVSMEHKLRTHRVSGPHIRLQSHLTWCESKDAEITADTGGNSSIWQGSNINNMVTACSMSLGRVG